LLDFVRPIRVRGEYEIDLDAGKKTFERRKEPMRMPRLRGAEAERGRIVEHDDLSEMGRNGLGRCEASHPRADDDSLLQNRIGHGLLSRWARRRIGQSPADREAAP
jgi:hypothetical protein